MSFLLPSRIRDDFPILHTQVHGQPLVYLDNAATTQKPQCVIDALTQYYTSQNANIHRGIHYLAEAATIAFEDTRSKVARFINAPSERSIIFTRNATESINLVARSWGEHHLQAGDEIVLTQLEHHSNLIPWQLVAQKTGATLKFIPITEDGRLDLAAIDQVITRNTKIVAFTLMSNVLGTITPARTIIDRAKAVGAVTLCDASQSSAHTPTNVQALDCDFLVFSAHKMCGPTGVGILYGKEALLEAMPPFLGGGEMISFVEWDKATWSELPSKFEAGTPNIADVIAFGAAIDYLEKIGMENIHRHEMTLTAHTLALMQDHPHIKVFGPLNTCSTSRTCGVEGGTHTALPGGGATQAPVIVRGGVVSFDVQGVHPHDLSTLLDHSGIAIRAGHHCAQPLMTLLGVSATARASYYFYNTLQEVDALITAIDKAYAYFHNRVKATDTRAAL